MATIDELIDEATGHMVDLKASRAFDKWAADKEICGCTTCSDGVMKTFKMVREMFEDMVCAKDAMFRLELARQLIANTTLYIAQQEGSDLERGKAAMELLTAHTMSNVEKLMMSNDVFIADKIITELTLPYKARMEQQMKEEMLKAGFPADLFNQ